MKPKWLWVVFVIGLLLRILTLNNALSFDEYVQARAVLDVNDAGLDKLTEMNPLTTWTRIAVTKVLGIEVWSLRLTSLIFALLTVCVAFLLARELYGKKTAYWSAVLISLSAWHGLVSTSISFDGAFLTFYTVLALFCFASYEKTGKNQWLVACGIASGLAVLTKYTGVLVIVALAFYSLIKSKDLRETIKQSAVISLVALGVFSIFPIIAFVFSDPGFFWITLQHGKGYFGRDISLVALAIQYALALLWAGPLLFFGYFLSWKYREQKDWLFHSFVIVVLAFYTFVVQDPFRPVERYFTVLLPVLCILTGKWFAGLRLSPKQWKFFAWALVLSVVAAFVINSLPNTIIAFYPKTNFIKAVLSLKWLFWVPFTGDQGPVGFYVSFLIFALAFIICVVCAVIALRNNKKASALLLAVGLGLGVFMMAELSLHPTSPDISRVVHETASFVNSHPVAGPMYTFRDYAIQYYLGSNATNIDFGADAEKVRQDIKNSTLVVIDFPMLDKNSGLWKTFSACEQVHSVSDKGIVLGYVFRC